MMREPERSEIARLWQRKLRQDEERLPQSQRHRNLEPVSAELIHALAAGIGAARILEIGGSSGISTIALSAAARETSGRLTSIELESWHQDEARQTLSNLGLAGYTDFILGDAAKILPSIGEVEFVLIDCEKEDYGRFFDMLHVTRGGVVVADNIVSHGLADYVSHVRSRPGVESITLPVGKGLEVTRFVG